MAIGSGPTAATAWVDVLPSMRNFGASLATGIRGETTAAGAVIGGQLGDSIADSAGKRGNKIGSAIGKGVLAAGAGVAAAGALLYQAGKTFDDVSDNIRVKTGATGKALDGLVDTAKRVGTEVPADFAQVSDAVATLNQRLGITGEPLEQLSKQFLELSRLTKTDLQANITTLTKLFADWGVETEQQDDTLDKLFRATQAGGGNIDKLSGQIEKNGAVLKQMGFGLDESIALLASFEKGGVNTQVAMTGLRKMLSEVAKTGEEPISAFRRITDSIKNAGTEAEGNRIAFETFGARAGPELAAAIRSGKLSVDDMMTVLRDGKDTILGAANQTKDFAEQWQEFKNKVLVAIAPQAERFFAALGPAFEKFSTALLPILTTVAVGVFTALGAVFDFLAAVPVPVLVAATSLFVALYTISKVKKGLDFVTSAIEAAKGIGPALSNMLTPELAGKIGTKFGTALGVAIKVAALAGAVIAADELLPPVKPEDLQAGGWTEYFAQQRDDIHQMSEGLKQAFGDPAGFIKAQIADIGEEFAMMQAAWAERTAGIGQWWNGLWAGIVATAQQRWAELTGFFGNIGGWLTAFWLGLVGGIGAIWNGLWANAEVTFAGFITWIQATATGFASWLVVTWMNLGNTVSAWWTNTWNGIMAFFGNVVAWIQSTTTGFASWMTVTWIGLTSFISTLWTNFWNGVRAVLQTAINAVTTAISSFGSWFQSFIQGVVNGVGVVWAGIKRLLAAPINFMINTVWNNGIARAWNEVRKFIPGLGEAGHIPPIPENARGGVIPGYAPGVDKVLSWVSPGEAIMRPEWARALGKDAIDEMNKVARTRGVGGVWNYLFGGDKGSPGAMQQRKPPLLPGFQLGGLVASVANNVAVARGMAFARSMEGKPYVWGGAGPGGSDCSGFMSQITNSLLGRNPHSRLFTTASFAGGAAGGFVPGLISAFTIGVNQGNPGHMAGTLAGVNVESGSGHGPMVGKIALGSTSGFRGRFSLPQVGGAFVPGIGGQGGFDFTALVRDTINNIMNPLIASMNTFIGPPPPEFRRLPGELMRTVVTKVIDFAVQKASEMFGALGGGGGSEVWRGVVNQALAMMGLPLSLADTVLRRLQQESGGNASIVNNWDSNARRGTPSVGLMQVIGPTYATNRDPRHDRPPYLHGVSIDPLSNILASMRYTLARYGSLPAGYNRAGGYDSGGWLPPGFSTVFNGTGKPEAVLTDKQWRALSAAGGEGESFRLVGGELEIVGDGLARIVDGRLERVGTAISTGRRI